MEWQPLTAMTSGTAKAGVIGLCVRDASKIGSRKVSASDVPANQRLKLTGAAMLVFRASTSLQAATAA
jgi:hypothetical protein